MKQKPNWMPECGKDWQIADAMCTESFESGKRLGGGSIGVIVDELGDDHGFPTIVDAVKRRIDLKIDRHDPLHIGEVY